MIWTILFYAAILVLLLSILVTPFAIIYNLYDYLKFYFLCWNNADAQEYGRFHRVIICADLYIQIQGFLISIFFFLFLFNVLLGDNWGLTLDEVFALITQIFDFLGPGILVLGNLLVFLNFAFLAIIIFAWTTWRTEKLKGDIETTVFSRGGFRLPALLFSFIICSMYLLRILVNL
jgi:hypothetical protein